MKDVFKRKSEALAFNRAGDAYIHTEMRGGRDCETIMHGDKKALVWALTCEIEQVAAQTGTGVTELLGLINALHNTRNEVTGDGKEQVP